MKATFGEYIRNLRNKEGLTLTQLAAKLGLDSANLSKMETGKRDFSKKHIPILAKIFHLRFNELNEEFISDQVAKFIYESNCTKEILVVAEEKAEYRRQLERNTK